MTVYIVKKILTTLSFSFKIAYGVFNRVCLLNKFILNMNNNPNNDKVPKKLLENTEKITDKTGVV